MIDFSATLAPENGLVSARAVRPPKLPSEPLWQGLAELHHDRTGAPVPQDAALSPTVVGAYGISPSDTLTRAAGEAVERFALLPVDGEGGLARCDDLAWGLAPAGARLADPGTTRRELRWYPAQRLRGGEGVRVPAGLVDYPARAEDADGFDPSPSGAASGASREGALRSALLEVIERDAFLTAWYHRLPLRGLDADRFLAEAPHPLSPGMRRFRQALDAARAIGLSPVLARVPTHVPGVVCTVGVVVDRDGGRPLAAVGASASDDPGTSAVKALQEALQIRSALRLVQESNPAADPTRTPRNDLERAQYFASAPGVRAVERWIGSFTPPQDDFAPPQDGFAPPQDAEPDAPVPVTVPHLVASLHEQGVNPVAVDLSHRLPDRIRAMGWCAVKVIPFGMQALRMDDSLAFTWHAERLSAAGARFGLGTEAVRTEAEPHPLI